MKNIKRIALILFIGIVSTSFVKGDSKKCYICTGHRAYAYHRTAKCRGLNRCSGDVIQINISTAVKEYKRSPCKIFYKRN